jgi:hypothetical protein
VVERDSPVLSRRVAAFVVLGAAVGTWFVVAPHVAYPGLWPAILVVAFAVLPGTLALVFVALPLWRRNWILPAAIVLALIAFGTWEANWRLASNFAKLWAAVFFGWAFLRLFEELSWVVLVAAIVPIVDAISVFSPQGPTRTIVEHHFSVYAGVSVAFFAPGNRAADLGPPDLLFYALFLAASLRFRLRPGWTWLATTGMYSLALVIGTAADTGLPALPFLSFGFFVANADLLWQRFRPRPKIDDPATHP